MLYYGHKKLDQFLITNYFPTKKNGIVIECGAYDGINMSNTMHLDRFRQWNCIHLEANPILYQQLLLNRPNCINLNVALSNTNGTMIMETCRKLKNSRLTNKPQATSIKHTVQTITYPTLIKRLNLTHIDLFVLDVEGWEIPVIKGMKGCNVLPDIFCVEACPSSQKLITYEQVIFDTFGKLYKKDKSSWLNDVYVKQKIH